jgi:hypothetical protein
MNDTYCLPTMDDLTKFVHIQLCQKDALDPEQTPLGLTLITRKGKPCGLFFHVQGPRLLKNYAVWAGDENRILYYDASGERFGETYLSEGPDPRRLAA